jgi:hypothetical protein
MNRTRQQRYLYQAEHLVSSDLPMKAGGSDRYSRRRACATA